MVGRLLVILGLCGACRNDEPVCAPSGSGPARIRAAPVSVDRLVHAPRSYEGQTVRVTGDVARVLDDHAFLLRGDSSSSAPTVAIVGPTPGLWHVDVTGIAHAEVPAPLGHRIGSGPVVIASRIEPACLP
jgi:hypothetical protein